MDPEKGSAQDNRGGYRHDGRASTGTAKSRTGTSGREGAVWSDPLEAVRDAYDVVEENIRKGYEEAIRQSRSNCASGERNAGELIHRLSHACVELSVVLMDIAKAVVDRQTGLCPGQPDPGQSHGLILLPVTIRTEHVAHARAVLHRPAAGRLRALPLRLDRSDFKIESVSIADGPAVVINVPRGAMEGVYQGVIVEEAVDDAVGAITLRLSTASDA